MPPKKHSRTESGDGSTSTPNKQPRVDKDEYIDESAVLKHPTTARAKEIDSDPPFKVLTELLANNSNASDKKTGTVLHWFRSKDLRQEDNRGLHAASQKARESGASLITLYLHSPKDLDWHGTSAARSDFILESLRILKDQLAEKHIPLAMLAAEKRDQKVEKVLEFVKENSVSHVFANMEYEVDELRRDIDFVERAGKDGVQVEIVHDQTVIVPGELTTGNGGPHKVFTPYHKAWLAETKADPSLYDVVSPPEANDKKASQQFDKLFETQVPDLPANKPFASKEERDRIRKLWPAGHDAGMQRLRQFLDKKVAKYAAHRSEPAADVASRMSPYFATGLTSVREALQECQKHNEGASFADGDPGIAAWVRELVFREFYRHTASFTPHGSMNLPQNLKFDMVEWEDDEEGWAKWCEGKTGVPFVDAGMRQLNHEGYMHNRLRMNTSSYLTGNLLIDYRRGERFFLERLVDADIFNNTNGWEPSHTVFNPVSQAERLDKDGEYIRKWVPELKEVEGKAIFAPYERLSKEEFDKLGYPKPHVDFEETAQRAKERYKKGFRKAEGASG